MLSNLQVGYNCINNLVYTNQPQHVSGTYQVADFIQSNGLININENVSFKANDYLELNHFFEVILGAEFEAKIDGCN